MGLNADGTYVTRSIEELKEGDKVLTKDHLDADGRPMEGTVTRVYRSTTDRLQVVSVADESGNVEILRSTTGHPYYVVGLGWTAAADLRAGR